MRQRFALYITLFWSFAAQAQYLSVRGDFSVDQRRGCRDMLVTVTNINPGTDVILYQYEGANSTVTADTFYLYTATGNYWLYQYIQGATGQKADSIYIEIFDPVVPEVELQTCNNNDLQVRINDTNYDLYEIDYGDGTVVQVPVNTFPPIYSYATGTAVTVTVTGLYTTANNRCGSRSFAFTPVNQVQAAQLELLQVMDNNRMVVQYTLPANTVASLEISVNNTGSFQLLKNIGQGTSVDTIANLQPAGTTYCFRLASHDACSNFKAYSNELCSVYANVQAVDEALNLNWVTVNTVNYAGTAVLRDSSLLTTLSNQLNYADSTVECNTTYCYYLDIQHTDGSVSRSNQVCAQAFSTRPPATVTDVSTVIEENTIRWSWPTPANETPGFYTLYNSNGIRLDTTSQNNYQSAYLPGTDLCLQLQLTNNCGNPSASSNLFCPLTISHLLNNDGSVTLQWPPYTGWQNGVSAYTVVIYDGNMNQLDSLAAGNVTEYTDPLPNDNTQVSFYRVWAIPSDGNLPPSASNLIRVVRPPVIAIPSAFTPNGDNLNDVFVVSGKFIESIELTILNRWGSTIYQVNGSTWDGYVNGEKVPLGAYVYHVVIKDFTGKEHIRSGTVLILKD